MITIHVPLGAQLHNSLTGKLWSLRNGDYVQQTESIWSLPEI